jgi:hypothetical protein
VIRIATEAPPPTIINIKKAIRTCRPGNAEVVIGAVVPLTAIINSPYVRNPNRTIIPHFILLSGK